MTAFGRACAAALSVRLVARRAGRIDAAVNVGRDADRRRRQRMSDQERKRLRVMEVRRKIEVLKGRAGKAR